MKTRHLLTVWNPSYADDVMDQHLRVLIDWAHRAQKDNLEGDEVYVWWAKIRSGNRREPLPHLDEVLALQQQIDDNIETHLYLTDYRSLYVGNIDEITIDNILDDDELDHMPRYYQDRAVDVWFRLSDIRRLVANDTPCVIDELKSLRNVKYYDRPVSLYGGIVNLPLILERDDDLRWFGSGGALTDNILWAERDAENRGATERMLAELRDNLFGEHIWNALEHATRTFLASAEAVFRERRSDPAFDASQIAVSYAKAVETELNAVIFPPLLKSLAKAPPHERDFVSDGVRLDFGRPVEHQTLGAIRSVLERSDVARVRLTAAYAHDWKWLLGELPSRLEPLMDIRNPAAHRAVLAANDILGMRNDVLGIGGEGLIVRLALVKMRLTQT